MNKKIFLVGCWNKNSCLEDKKINGRTELINLLSIEKKKYNFGILLGDNIYPLKTNKRKTSKREATKREANKRKTYKRKTNKRKKFLYESIEFYGELLDISKEITKDKKALHVILGNHDVEKKCVLENQIRNFTTPFSNIYIKNTIFESDKAIFIMLNTNNIPNIIELFQEFDRSIIKDKWLIICGHEPIFSYKPKKKKNIIFQQLDESGTIFKSISNLNYNKIIYICADTHNYQLLEVGDYINDDSLCLPVVVVGTGGASPDSLKNIEDNLVYYDEDSELYASVIDYKDPYGFLELDIEEDKVVLNYKKCDSINSTTINYYKDTNVLSYTLDYQEIECKLPNPMCILEKEVMDLEVC